VAESARLGLDPPGEGRLGHPLLEELRGAVEDLVGEGCRDGDTLDLPGRLDRPQTDDVGTDVGERGAREELLEAPHPSDGQHVQLEAELHRQASVAGHDRRRKISRRGERDDVVER